MLISRMGLIYMDLNEKSMQINPIFSKLSCK